MGRLVKLDEVVPGMIIEKDVTNIQGGVLLRKDNEVIERHITIFKTWGVTSVYIKETAVFAELDGQSAQQAAEQQIEDMKKNIDAKFSEVSGDEAMRGIMDAAIRRRTKQILHRFNL